MGQNVVNDGPQIVHSPTESGLALVSGRGSPAMHSTVPALDDATAIDLIAAAVQGQGALDQALAALGDPWASWWASLDATTRTGQRAGLLRLRTLAYAIAQAQV